MAQYKNIDIVPDETITRVHLSQGDIGRTLIFYLFENALSWSVPASSTIKCQGTKPSGFGFSVSCTYSGNTVTCVTTDEMTDEYGQIEAELVITSSDESQVFGTSNFILDIEKNPHPDGTVDGDAENPVIANLEAVITQAVDDWLDEHPEATTTVVDGSLTEAKFSEALKLKTIKDYVTPEMFGAVGNGTTDDTQALIDAFESSRYVIFAKNKTYLVSSPIVVYDGTTVELCGSTILASSTGNHVFHNFEDDDTYLAYNGNGNIVIRNGYIDKGSIDFIHAQNVVIENVGFKNCKLDHYIEICACKNFVVRDCSFVGMDTTSTSQKEYINIDNCKYSNFPWLDENSVTFDGTVVDGVLVDNCIFDINTTSQEQDAVGKHSYYSTTDYTLNRAKNITIRDCKVYGATDQAFLFMGADNVTIENCYIDSCKRHYLMRYCSYVKISNNNVFGMTTNNIIDNSNYVEITNNSTRLSNEASYWDVQLQHTCNEVNYSYNHFVNYYGGRVPISFSDNSVMTNLKAMFNEYVVNSTSVKSVFTLGNNTMSFSFKAVDDVHFSSSKNDNTVTGIYDLTQFNRLIVQLGAIDDNTYIECVVKSFAGRNFVVGETYYVPVNVSSTPTLGFATLTITDAHTLTSTGLKIRAIKCQKLPSA